MYPAAVRGKVDDMPAPLPHEWPDDIWEALAAGRISNESALQWAQWAVDQDAAAGQAVAAARGEVGDEFSRLFPAAAPLGPPLEPAPASGAALASSRAAREPISDAELHERLFGGGDQFTGGAGAQAAAAPGHVAFTGTHTHSHPAYQAGDSEPARHVHAHSHHGDANHAPGDFHPHG